MVVLAKEIQEVAFISGFSLYFFVAY